MKQLRNDLVLENVVEVIDKLEELGFNAKIDPKEVVIHITADALCDLKNTLIRQGDEKVESLKNKIRGILNHA